MAPMKKSKRPAASPQGSAPQSGRSPSLLVPSNEYYDQSTQVEEAPFDEEGQDPMLQPPLWLFILGWLEISWGLASNIFQVITSWAGIMGWQQHEMVVKYGLAKSSSKFCCSAEK